MNAEASAVQETPAPVEPAPVPAASLPVPPLPPAAVEQHADYDPAEDPAVAARPTIRIRLRKPGVAKGIPASQLTADQLLHNTVYVIAERNSSLMGKVKAIEKRLKETPDDDINGSVDLLSEMIGLLLDDAEALPAVLTQAWALDVATMEYLARTAGWIQQKQEERVDAGNA